MEWDWRQVLGALAEAVVAADRAGMIVFANAAAEELLGYPAGGLAGRALTQIIPDRLQGAHSAGFGRFLATGQSQLMDRQVRLPALRQDGTEIRVELTLSALRGGEEDLLLASLRDAGAQPEAGTAPAAQAE
jgi:PAS domain S-box-containing protein